MPVTATAKLTCTQEVDRAIDNLVKSGKFYSPGSGPRRESIRQGGMMAPARQYMDHGMSMIYSKKYDSDATD